MNASNTKGFVVSNASIEKRIEVLGYSVPRAPSGKSVRRRSDPSKQSHQPPSYPMRTISGNDEDSNNKRTSTLTLASCPAPYPFHHDDDTISDISDASVFGDDDELVKFSSSLPKRLLLEKSISSRGSSDVSPRAPTSPSSFHTNNQGSSFCSTSPPRFPQRKRSNSDELHDLVLQLEEAGLGMPVAGTSRRPRRRRSVASADEAIGHSLRKRIVRGCKRNGTVSKLSCERQENGGKDGNGSIKHLSAALKVASDIATAVESPQQHP